MPRSDLRTCKHCGRHSDVVGPISHQRCCAGCGKTRQADNYDQLKDGSGPFAEHWERRLIMSIVRRQTKRRKEAT